MCSRGRRINKVTTWLLLAVFLMALLPAEGFAYNVNYEERIKEPVAEGVTVETINQWTPEGLVKVFVMTVDLTNPYVKVDTMVGTGGDLTRAQAVSRMAAENGAVAAINGDFFQMDEKAPIGLTVQAGEVVSSPAQRNDMYGFGLAAGNVPVVKVFKFEGAVTAPNGQAFQLFGVNKPTYLLGPGAESDVNHLNLYNSRWGDLSRGKLPGLTGVVEMVVENDIVRELRTDQAGVAIPANGYVLAGHGLAAKFITDNFKVGSPVQVTYGVNGDELQAAVGGQAMLVNNGQRSWFTQNITGKRARTAIGASRDGKTLYLVVVEGGNGSRGMTQEELADFMVTQGVWQAVNLDGGGSSTIVARPLGDENIALLNKPVYTSERPVPTAVGIFSTAPRGALAGLKVTGEKNILVGTSRPITAKGYDEHYNPYRVNPDEINWTVEPAIGNIENGVFKAVYAGNAVITASFGGISETYPVHVLGSEDIARVEILPGNIELLPGEAANLSVRVVTKQNQTFMLQAGEVSWSASGDIGTVAGNKFVAGSRQAVGELTARVDGTTAKAPVSVGTAEKPFASLDSPPAYLFTGYPAGVTGSFRNAGLAEPTFRGGGAARLQYDFRNGAGTRAVYGKFGKEGLTLSGRPRGITMMVEGTGGNGHWLRGIVTDAAGAEKTVDFARNVDWQGWRQVTAVIPAGLKYPVQLSAVYLVEPDESKRDAGVIYFDQINLLQPVTAKDLTPAQPPAEAEESAGVTPSGSTEIKLGTGISVQVPAGAVEQKTNVTLREKWQLEQATPGHDPQFPVFSVTPADDAVTKFEALVIIRAAVKNGDGRKARLMWWHAAAGTWIQVPARVEAAGTVMGKFDRPGLYALMTDSRPEPAFNDLSGSWAKDVILDLAGRRVVSGYPDGRFQPGKGVTRAEFITMLAKALGWTAEGSAAGFRDEIPTWASGAVNAAVRKGIVKGYEDGTFRPNKTITRAEMAVMIDKALALPKSNKPSAYKDAGQIPAWAVQSIRNTKSAGLLTGSGGLFRPKDVANRAESTAVLDKLIDYYLQ